MDVEVVVMSLGSSQRVVMTSLGCPLADLTVRKDSRVVSGDLLVM